MSDIIDQGCEMEEKQRKQALEFRRATLKPCGLCYQCSDDIQAGIFCSADCRIDYEAREAARVRNGA
jgi:hypothetical protein